MDETNDISYRIIADGEYLCLYKESGNLMYKRVDNKDLASIIEGANYGNHKESGHSKSS